MYPLGISIVIPTEGRSHLTTLLLEGLVEPRQHLGHPTEVIVVDSSQGQEQEVIETSCHQFQCQLLAGPRNVRKKRNIGLAQANLAVILFLDSDCQPTRDVLEHHFRHYKDREPNLGGVVGQTIFEGPQSFAWKLVANSSLVSHFTQAATSPSASWGTTSNISFSHEVLDRVGHFDTNFPFRLGGDDLDLSYRVTKAGYALRCEPKAVVNHSRSTWNGLGPVFGRAFRWGRMEYHLFAKHAESRVPSPPDFWGWFLLVGFLLMGQSLASQNFLFLWGLLGWTALALFLFSAFASLSPGHTTPTTSHLRVFIDNLSTAPIELTYRLGVMVEFLRHGDWRFLWSRAWFGTDAPQRNWLMEAWNLWSNVLALLVVQGILFLVCWEGS